MTNSINRGEIVDSKINNAVDNNEQVLSVLLEDIDGAIDYYFKHVMHPRVTQQGGMVIDVPVIYGSPERWIAATRDGYFRDNKGRIQTPLIMFKRNSIAQDSNIPIDKLDANNPNLFYTVEKKYTQKNRFDQYNILTNQIPVKEYYNVIIPDYVVVTYDVILWTSYVSQMNKLIEALIYSSGAYWGDKSKFRFRTTVSDISTPVEITTEAERTSRGTLTLTANGYLVPDTINKVLSQKGQTVNKSLSIKKKVFFIETSGLPTSSSIELTQRTLSNVSFGSNITLVANEKTIGNLQDTLRTLIQYINRDSVKTATSINPDIGDGTASATFLATMATSSVDNFYDLLLTEWHTTPETYTFHINGQGIEPSAIVSSVVSGSQITLTVNTGSLGFAFESNDSIWSVGRFGRTKASTITVDDGGGNSSAIFVQNTSDRFRFYANGTEINQDSITAFNVSGSSAALLVNTSSLGYAFDVNDNIWATGRFSKLSLVSITPDAGSGNSGALFTENTPDNFIFFINGQTINSSSIVSLTQVGSNTVLLVNTSSLGYAVAADDEVWAIGKFI